MRVKRVVWVVFTNNHSDTVIKQDEFEFSKFLLFLNSIQQQWIQYIITYRKE